MERRKWSGTARESVSASIGHCVTAVGCVRKGASAFKLTPRLGVVCILRGHPARRGRQEIGAMRYVGRATRLAAASTLLLALGACSDGSGDPGEPSATPTLASPTTASLSPTATATKTPPSDSEVAAEAAEEKVRQYYDVRDQLGLDPTSPLGLLRQVATSIELEAQERLFRKERSRGLVQTGHTRIAELVVQSVDLTNSDPEAGQVPTVQVDVCYDVTDVDVVDGEGESTVNPDRPETGWIRYFVSNYEWATDPSGAWRVATSESLERAPCDAS
jgi:hypothetical protein